MTTVTGLRERKKAHTRQVIEATALHLFEREGFEHTTVEAIAAACDVSPRTFFRYFGSKEDVLHAEADSRLARLVELLRARPVHESPFAALRQAVLAASAEYDPHNEALHMRFRVMETNPTLAGRALANQQRWESQLVAALAERVQRAGGEASTLELRLVAGSALAAFRAAVAVWQGDRSTDIRTLVQLAFDRLADGLDHHQ